ncbi:MAG: MipA/OmpV family protein [Planctomycetes bacterium]|nr:MipA/OmpV family protein [Planctomycetota bacterium]
MPAAACCAIPCVASLALLAVPGLHAEEVQPHWLPSMLHADAAGDQQGPPGPPERTGDWTFALGVATRYQPAFTGSADYQLIAFPDFKVEYKDRFFAAPFEGMGYNIINSDGWRIGPIAKFDFGRTEDDDNPFRIAGEETTALKGLGDVDMALELGGFLEYSVGPLSYSIELRQGLGGHEGLIGETNLQFMGFADVFGPPIMYAFGPQATFADSTYNSAYYGITAQQSARSGLDRYTADAGLVSYGIGASVIMPLTESVSIAVFGSYDRMAGSAADSPLIQERGDEDQLMIHVGMRYEFGH